MKKYLVVFFFFLLSHVPLRAQWAGDFILFFLDVVQTCDEVGYTYKPTLFSTNPGELHEIKFGWALTDRFSLGATASFGTNRVQHWDKPEKHNLTFGYGTFMGEYHFRKPDFNKWYHWSVFLQAGKGYSSIQGAGVPQSFQTSSNFWVLEPGGNFNVTAFEVLRLNIGVGYRMILGSQLYGQTDWTLSGPCLTIGALFSGRGF